jgi:hypothetical protein
LPYGAQRMPSDYPSRLPSRSPSPSCFDRTVSSSRSNSTWSSITSQTHEESMDLTNLSFQAESANEKVVQTTPEIVKKALNALNPKRLRQIHEKIRSATTGVPPATSIDSTHETTLRDIAWSVYRTGKAPIWAGKPHSSRTLGETIIDFPVLNKSDIRSKSRYSRVHNVSRIPIDDQEHKRTLTIEVLGDSNSRDPIVQLEEYSVPKLTSKFHAIENGRVLVYFSGLKSFIKTLQAVDETPLIQAAQDHFDMPHVYLHKTLFDDSTGVLYDFIVDKENADEGAFRETLIRMSVKGKSVGSITFPWHTTTFVLREVKAMAKLIRRNFQPN